MRKLLIVVIASLGILSTVSARFDARPIEEPVITIEKDGETPSFKMGTGDCLYGHGEV